MSIIDCILSYLKPKKKDEQRYTIKKVEPRVYQIYNKRGEEIGEPIVVNELAIPDSYVEPFLEKIFWRLRSLYHDSVTPKTNPDKITFIGGGYNYAPDLLGRVHYTFKFQSDLGPVGIVLGRTHSTISERSEPFYDMNYKGIDGRSMFHTIKGFVETENGYTVEECKLAIKELLDYLNEIIPATK